MIPVSASSNGHDAHDARLSEPEMRASVQTPPPVPASGITYLPSGSAVGSFVLQRVQSADGFGVCYLATSSASDSEVVIEEYLPAAIARRDADGSLGPRSPAHAALWADGLQAFLQESEQMSRLQHPSLLRIGPVWQARGTAYRLRVGGEGRPLTELVTAMTAPPGEPWLRKLLDPLLGALQAMHEAGWVHGNVRPGQIMMRADGSPVLLDSGAVRTAIGERLPELEEATPEAGFLPPELTDATLDWPVGPWSDLHALAQVLRYCMTGQAPMLRDPGAPLVDADARPSLGPRSLHTRYAPGLVAALERSLCLEPRQRPQSVAEFRHAVDAPVMLRAVPVSATVRPAPAPAEPRVDPRPPQAPRHEPPPGARGAAGVAFSLDAVRGRTAAPREPAWAVRAPPEHVHHEPAQIFDFHSGAGAGAGADAARGFTPAAHPAHAAGAPRAWRWPWALGGLLAGAMATGAAVFLLDLQPGAQVQFAIGPPGAGPAAPIAEATPPVADPRLVPAAPSGATNGMLPGTALPPQSNAAAPQVAAPSPAAPAVAAPPIAAAPVAAPPVAAPPVAAPPVAAPPVAAPPAAAAAATAVPARPISEVRQAAPAAAPVATEPTARAAGGEDAAPPAETSGGEGAEPASTPLAACSPRTNFALYRCMQTQCERSQFYAHPQCIRLRVRDELP